MAEQIKMETDFAARQIESNGQSQTDLKASFNVNDVKIDLENWMGKLPSYLTCVPIIYLSIPGSHNSFSYSISPSSEVSPDSPPLVQSLGRWCKPIANRVIYNWSKGQKQDVVQQLNRGIRYFDVRLVAYDNEIFISHGLYGGQIFGFLEQMNSFLNSHQREVVILDFQHFYNFQPEHHERMISMMMGLFGDKICRRQRRMKENSLDNLWQCRNQVLIIYRNQVTRFNDIFWPSGTWTTPWPNTVNLRELIQYLSKGLASRKEGSGYVSQGILTPTTKYVALHVFGSLKNLALRTNKKLVAWLETKNNGANGVNVIICDFVESCDFCEKVVLLNYKGADDYQKHFNLTDDMNQYQKDIKY